MYILYLTYLTTIYILFVTTIYILFVEPTPLEIQKTSRTFHSMFLVQQYFGQDDPNLTYRTAEDLDAKIGQIQDWLGF